MRRIIPLAEKCSEIMLLADTSETVIPGSTARALFHKYFPSQNRKLDGNSLPWASNTSKYIKCTLKFSVYTFYSYVYTFYLMTDKFYSRYLSGLQSTGHKKFPSLRYFSRLIRKAGCLLLLLSFMQGSLHAYTVMASWQQASKPVQQSI